MSKKRRRHPGAVRDAPVPETSGKSMLVNTTMWDTLLRQGFRPLADCPEVQICIGIYADLIGSMTLRLMQNTASGDVRVKNALAHKVDVEPSRYMTRATFMQHLVRVLLTYGNQVTYPVYNTTTGYLDDLKPLKPGQVSFVENQDMDGYTVRYLGRVLDPDQVLHFVFNPDMDRPWMGRGLDIALKDAVDSLRQSVVTKNALLKSPSPSIIVKVDGLTEEFASTEGRRILRQQYIDASDNGQPWFIPSEAFSVEQVRPVTITDLAIGPNMELDKRTIAAVFGIPAFLVGVGTFNRDEYQNFVSTRVLALAKIIEQELTKKTLWADNLYWKFSQMSLYSYSMTELVNAGKEMVDRMALYRNEWRDWMGLPPKDDMDELLALENYVPADRLGDQKKLESPDEQKGGDESNESEGTTDPDGQ